MSAGTLPLYWPGRGCARVAHSTSSATVEIDFSSAFYLGDGCTAQSPETQPSTAAVSRDAVTSSDYVVTLERIAELQDNEDDRPSKYAYAGALKVLVEAARELSIEFPRASASVGPNGGLRITWSSAIAEVRLVIGGSEANKSYIYSESGLLHGVDYNLDGRHLAGHIRWFLREG